MNFCASCGAKVSEQSSFCSNCGQPRGSVTSQPQSVDPYAMPAAPKNKTFVSKSIFLIVIGVLLLVALSLGTLAIINFSGADSISKQISDLESEMV